MHSFWIDGLVYVLFCLMTRDTLLSGKLYEARPLFYVLTAVIAERSCIAAREHLIFCGELT